MLVLSGIDDNLVRDPTFPVSVEIGNVGLQSEGENAVLITRKKYNRTKKTFHLHYDCLSIEEFELLLYFYEIECNYGLKGFFWRYPILSSNVSDIDVGHCFQNKIFYVSVFKFDFKAVSYNNYQGDIVLLEI